MNTRYCPKFIGTLAIVAAALAQLANAQDKAPPARERIGIYDSRAIAVAYVGSEAQTNLMTDMNAQMKRARDAGDTRTITRLEKEGHAWQSRLHQQGFGTAPVDDLLAEIARELPAIQKAAGVTNLVSKWNPTELNRHPHAEPVDVTMALVDAFHPNARQRQHAIEIQKAKPQKVK